MPSRDIILIGASAGGVQTLAELVRHLPRDLPAAVFIVLHISPFGSSSMPAILSRSGFLPAAHPKDGDPIEVGKIYMAPPDHHLVIEPERVRLSRGPTENSHRPAVDVLFRTGAEVYGPRVMAVVLTGNLDDGTVGLAIVKKHGGTTIVQDPREADYPGMPRSAIASVDVDHVLPVAGIASLLVNLTRQPLAEPEPPRRKEGTMAIKEELEQGKDREGKGAPSGLTCPDCGGSLFERQESGLIHFRCRTGHAYSSESLLAKQSQSLEATLWAAVRSLEENAALARRMERRTQPGLKHSVAIGMRYARRAEEAEKHADVLRGLLMEEPSILIEEPRKAEGGA
jgi:two-component system, chemotaxis family, protein-glutamate methylesterase/glutaminase